MVYIIGDSADLSPAERTATPKVGLHSYGASAALSVSPGVNLTVEGMQLYSAKTALLCDGGASATPTSVRLIRSIIGSSDVGIESRPGCDLTVEGMVGERNGKLVILNPAYDLRPLRQSAG